MMKSSVILLGKEEEKLLNEVIDELLKCNLINEIIVVTDDRKIDIDFERNNIKIKTLYQKEKGYGSAILKDTRKLRIVSHSYLMEMVHLIQNLLKKWWKNQKIVILYLLLGT